MKRVVLVGLCLWVGCGKEPASTPGDAPASAEVAPAAPIVPAGPICTATQRGGDTVAGLGALWDSGIDCPGAPQKGRFSAEIAVDNTDPHPLEIERFELLQVVPGPLRKLMESGRIAVSGEPIVIPAAGRAVAKVEGLYELSVDETRRGNANLKVLMLARSNGRPVKLPVNIHLRAETGPERDGAGRPGGGDPRFEREPGDD